MARFEDRSVVHVPGSARFLADLVGLEDRFVRLARPAGCLDYLVQDHLVYVAPVRD